MFENLWGKVKQLFGNGTPRVNVWGIGTTQLYSPIEQEQALSKGFNSNTAVYSIVKKYAKKAASIPIYLENPTTDEPYDSTSPLVMLLNRPNERQSTQAFLKLVFGGYKLFGEAFIWLNRGDQELGVNTFGELYERPSLEYAKMPVLEMYVIPANRVVVIPSREDPNEIGGYQLQNRPDIKIRKEDMIHWMDINLDFDEFARPQLRGMTPLKPGYKTLTADNSFIDSMVRMAQNDGAKGVLANRTIGQISPKQETAMRKVMDEKVNSKEVKNQIAAFEGDWVYHSLGLTSVDMQTLEAREFIYKEMCFLFDVPYGFFDSHTPYAEKQLAARDWISNSIQPDCKEFNGELQRVLFLAFGLTDQVACIKSNFDGLPEMQEDKKMQAEWLMKTWPITPNEVREALDYEPLPDPKFNEPWTPANVTPDSERIDPGMQATMEQIAQNDNTGTGDDEIPKGGA